MNSCPLLRTYQLIRWMAAGIAASSFCVKNSRDDYDAEKVKDCLVADEKGKYRQLWHAQAQYYV